MSKETKFLSICLNVLRGIQEQNPGMIDQNLQNMTGDGLLAAMKDAENELNQIHIFYKGKETDRKSGKIRFEVKNENAEGIPAQVKLFPLNPDETIENFNRVNNRIDMIRDMTDEEGVLETELPYGKYVAEISKGSEYEIQKSEFDISSEINQPLSIVLKRFVNLEKDHFYAGDIHHHSIFSSPLYGGDDDVKDTPEQVCNSMRAMGLTFGALSDHHNILNHETWKSQKKDDFVPIISKEISTSNGHVLALGVEHDVIYKIPKKEERTDEYLRGEFRRIVAEIKAAGGTAQLNHPCDLSRSTSWNPDYYDMIDIFDSLEIWNGSKPMTYGTTNARAIHLWKNLLDKGIYLPATTGSDTHNIKANDYNVIFDKALWISRNIEKIKNNSEISHDNEEKLTCIENIVKYAYPIVEKWAETNLTSGAIRTYAYVEGKPDQSRLLNAIKRGNTFLTNGPIIIPDVKDAMYGEKTDADEISFRIISNNPVDKLSIYGSTYEKHISLKEDTAAMNKKYHSCSIKISTAEFKKHDCRWIFMIVHSDCTNMAITNPVFI